MVHRALCSIIALTEPCPYPAVFTKQEWKKIIRENPYAITGSVLPEKTAISLRNASAASLEGDLFLSPVDSSEIARAASRTFNDM
jgi:hypothetical protein